jgi:hypothetical protein
MTELMNRAIERAKSLDEGEQDALAAILLEELEDEERWGQTFSSAKSQDFLEQMAGKIRSDVAAGRTEKLDVRKL